MKRLRYLLALGCAVSLIACGDDEQATTTATTSAAVPEDVIASDAQVASGLTDLKRAASRKQSKALEGFWKPVEGTVKKNEPDMYATIEEDLSLLGSGDAKKTATGAGELGETVDAYLAKHPG
jgi:hypothetical protein